MRTQLHKRSWLLASIGAAYIVGAIGVTSMLAGPTRGPIPEAAFPARGGPIDRNLVPAFIPALDAEGHEVGWVSRDDAVPVVDTGDRQLIPVYGDDLRTVVGHMVAGYGFAPLGTDVQPMLDLLEDAPMAPANSE